MQYVKVNGIWKIVKTKYAKVDGVWRNIINEYTKVSGVWRVAKKLLANMTLDLSTMVIGHMAGSGSINYNTTDGYLYMQVSGANTDLSAVTPSLVDLTGYSSIEVTYDFKRQDPTDSVFSVIVVDTDNNESVDSPRVARYSYEELHTTEWVYNHMISLDVSSLSGQYYIRHHIRNAGSISQTINSVIKSITLKA